MKRSLGNIGYDAYRDHTGGKSLISGAPIPPFVELHPPIQEAWEKAGQAVAASVGRSGEIMGEIPDGSDAVGEASISRKKGDS